MKRNEKELKSKARKLLNSYLLNKSAAEIKELEIQEVKNNYDITGMNIQEKTGKTNKINKELEERIINKEFKIKKLQKIKRLYELECEKIDRAVEILKEFEREVIILKYMTSPVMQWNDIGIKLGFSTIACQRAEERAIKKIIPILFKKCDV